MTPAPPSTTQGSTPALTPASRLRQAARERHPLLGALLGVAALHLLGFGLLLFVVAPADLKLGSGEAFGIGLGLTAYTLGMRHAFDADHIAAIDNTTRKFVQEGKRPHAAGFFFSAGHSTVVLLLALLVAFGIQGIGGTLEDENSALNLFTGTWGPTIAGLFLLTIGAINFGILRRSVALWRRSRRGELTTEELDQQLFGKGLLGRTTQRIADKITAPWQLYPTGFLFGLGFDTASEIALLVLAGGGAAAGIPFLAILALPVLFAAGMTLLDTLNGAAMTRAYGWSRTQPTRRLAYNAGVTAVSVVFAVVIGSLSLIGVLVERLHIEHGPLASLASISVDTLGFWLLGIVLAAWLITAVVLVRSSARLRAR